MIYGTPEFNDTLVRVIKEKYRHPYYQKAVDLAKAMSVHVYGDKPVELLERVRPGEDDTIKQYRLANYEPTTKAPCGKAIKIVSKIFNPNLSSIIFPKDNEQAQKLKKYTMEYFPVYNSLTVYNKDVTLKKMIADANALMVVKPSRRPSNDAERVKPVIVIYGSEVVYNWDFEHYLIYIGEEKVNSEIIYTFEYYDYVRILRFKAKVSAYDKLTLEELLQDSYTHNFINQDGDSEIPAWRLGGNSVPLPDGEVMFESFFADAQAHWNLSIVHESDILGSFTKHMNPQRMVIGEECRHERLIDGIAFRCHNGMLKAIGGKSSSLYACEACNGTGKFASDPYSDHIVLKSKLDELEKTGMLPVEYVRVPVDATKLLVERAKDMVHEGNAAINMDVEDRVGANQSGIAKVYDRSGQSNTIYDIGVRMYDVTFNNQFYFINKLMFGTEDRSAGKNTDENLPQVNKPTSFDIETISELLAGLKDAKAAGVDRNVQQAKEIAYISRDMDTNPDLKRYYIAVIDLDPLYAMTQDDIDALMPKGVIRKTDVAIHANLKPFVDRALSDNKDFLDLPKEEKLKILEKFANELIKAEEPKLVIDEPEPFSQGN
jgi:hypothetical protein